MADHLSIFLLLFSSSYTRLLYRADTLNSNFRHFERAAEGHRDQIRISHFERDFGEFGNLFAQDSNGRALRTNLWDGLQHGASRQRLDCCVLGWSWSLVAYLCFCAASAPTCLRPSSICRIRPLPQPPTCHRPDSIRRVRPLPQPARAQAVSGPQPAGSRAAYSRATSTEPAPACLRKAQVLTS